MRATTADLNHVIDHASSDLFALKGARLFITGGTGYIGRWLLESICYANQLLDLNITITLLSRDPNKFLSNHPHLSTDSAITFVTGDVRGFQFPEGEFTHAIHAATDVIAVNTPLDTFDVTVCGTKRVLDFCKQRGVANALLLSSGAVYGSIPHHLNLIPEEYLGRPNLDSPGSAYGIGKIVTEWLGNTYSTKGMACKSARIFAQIGPHLALDKQFAAGNFILNAINNEPFIIKGNGTPLRSYMYATDLVIWLLGILIRGQACRAYNVGSDHAISIKELALMIAKISEVSDPNIKILGKTRQETPPEHYVPDISRAKDELNLKISIPLDEALRRTIEWYRPHLSRENE